MGMAVTALIAPSAFIELSRTAKSESLTAFIRPGTARDDLISPNAQLLLRRAFASESFKASKEVALLFRL